MYYYIKLPSQHTSCQARGYLVTVQSQAFMVFPRVVGSPLSPLPCITRLKRKPRLVLLCGYLWYQKYYHRMYVDYVCMYLVVDFISQIVRNGSLGRRGPLLFLLVRSGIRAGVSGRQPVIADAIHWALVDAASFVKTQHALFMVGLKDSWTRRWLTHLHL